MWWLLPNFFAHRKQCLVEYSFSNTQEAPQHRNTQQSGWEATHPPPFTHSTSDAQWQQFVSSAGCNATTHHDSFDSAIQTHDLYQLEGPGQQKHGAITIWTLPCKPHTVLSSFTISLSKSWKHHLPLNIIDIFSRTAATSRRQFSRSTMMGN